MGNQSDSNSFIAKILTILIGYFIGMNDSLPYWIFSVLLVSVYISYVPGSLSNALQKTVSECENRLPQNPKVTWVIPHICGTPAILHWILLKSVELSIFDKIKKTNQVGYITSLFIPLLKFEVWDESQKFKQEIAAAGTTRPWPRSIDSATRPSWISPGGVLSHPYRKGPQFVS